MLDYSLLLHLPVAIIPYLSCRKVEKTHTGWRGGGLGGVGFGVCASGKCLGKHLYVRPPTCFIDILPPSGPTGHLR